MRRAPLALAGTVTGLVLVLGYRTPESAPTTSASASTSSGSAASGSAASGTGTSGTATSATKTVAGDTIQTRYGPVQVQVTAAAGTITDVTALQLPGNDPRSAQISQYSGPVLREQALAAQSAQIDGVSGATFTSDGYARSLQAALDALGIGA